MHGNVGDLVLDGTKVTVSWIRSGSPSVSSLHDQRVGFHPNVPRMGFQQDSVSYFFNDAHEGKHLHLVHPWKDSMDPSIFVLYPRVLVLEPFRWTILRIRRVSINVLKMGSNCDVTSDLTCSFVWTRPSILWLVPRSNRYDPNRRNDGGLGPIAMFRHPVTSSIG